MRTREQHPVRFVLCIVALLIAGQLLTIGGALAVFAPNGAPGVALAMFGALLGGAAVEELARFRSRPLSMQELVDDGVDEEELDMRARASEFWT